MDEVTVIENHMPEFHGFRASRSILEYLKEWNSSVGEVVIVVGGISDQCLITLIPTGREPQNKAICFSVGVIDG